MATKTTKPVSKHAPASKKAKVKAGVTGLSARVLGADGKEKQGLKLPESVFAVKVNADLVAQAVRVYRMNQRMGTAKAKTRGEVVGSTRKIYRQKGTGRARHGNIRAPIFVGGGIVFGPVPRDYSLKIPVKMKRAALASALTMKHNDKGVVIADGLDVPEAKTKRVASALNAMEIKGTVLLAVSKDATDLIRAARNIGNVDIIRAVDLHPYAVLSHGIVVMTPKAVEELEKRFS